MSPRGRKPPPEPYHVFTARPPQSLWQRLWELARREGRSVNAILCRAAEIGLKHWRRAEPEPPPVEPKPQEPEVVPWEEPR
jgi:hypothetical protein